MISGLGSFDERSLHVATGFGATHSVALYTVRGTGWPERFPLTPLTSAVRCRETSTGGVVRPKLVVVIGLMAVLASGCAASPTTPTSAPTASPAPVSPSASAAASGPSWTDDLAFIDAQVRARHPDPFAINPESAWVAKLAELEKSLPDATPDEQLAQLAGLSGLLDTHSSLVGAFHYYPAFAYRFPEGWFVVAARDESLVGSRLVSIGGTPVEQVESALRPLVPADNESGELIGVEDAMSTVELLHGLGIVDDTSKPGFVFEKADGSQITADLEPEAVDSEWIASLNGYLLGDATGGSRAARRAGLDSPRRAVEDVRALVQRLHRERPRAGARGDGRGPR